jgi:putrescine aminotransferase
MIVSDRLYSTLTDKAGRGQIFANGYTYSAHPVSCAAGMANLDIFEREDICGHVRKIGPYFHEQLSQLIELDVVGDVRGSHFMVCVECTADKKNKTVPPAEWEVGRRIFEKCQTKGLLARPLGHLVVLSPPLIINRAQIDDAVAILRQSIIDVMDDLTREGLRR